jgi:quercetin dioxygenase-like cupin family protein
VASEFYHAAVAAAELAALGYATSFVSRRAPGEVSPTHTQPFGAKVVLLSGSLTLRLQSGGAVRYHAGDSFLMPRDARHQEEAGPCGAVLLVGGRPA